MANVRQKLLEAIERKEDRLVKLTAELVRFNTTSPTPGQEPVDDKECQLYAAEQLKRLGFKIDLWEPDISRLSHYPFYIEGQTFSNRPILAARLKGAGGGRSLILNAHLDVVPAEGAAKWKHEPWGGEIVDGKVFGRGSCDMKGGAAAIMIAIEAIRDAGLELKGDIIVQTVLDEEINGMGTVACIERGYTADAAIIPEPSNLNLWIATRGLLWARATVEGRSGHAEFKHPDWDKGGAVNAIEKACFVLQALRNLESDWSASPRKRHDLLSTPRIVPTIVRGGDFWATIPNRCEIEMDIQYLPNDRDERGFGGNVKREIEEHLTRSCQQDPWLCLHPPKIRWIIDLPPMEVEQSNPLVKSVLSVAEIAHVKTQVVGFDSWDDGAHLMSLAQVPSVSIGPGPTEQAHVVDEFVTIDSLVGTAKILCLAILDWCGNNRL